MKGLRLVVAFAVIFGITSARAAEIGYFINVDVSNMIDQNGVRLLKSRLESPATMVNIPVADDNALFLTASLSPVDEVVVEGGMSKLYQSTYELTLTAENPILGVKFGTQAITLNGCGSTQAKAKNEALKALSPADAAVSGFLTATSAKAEAYYRNNFDAILTKARTIAASGAYEEAIALLWSLPADGVDSQTLYAEIEAMYKMMQTSECGRLVSNARSAFALKRYEEAAEWLRAVDENSPCATEAKLINQQIAEAFAKDQEQERQRAAAEQARRDKLVENENRRRHSLQRSLINSISNIASAYLKSRRRH